MKLISIFVPILFSTSVYSNDSSKSLLFFTGKASNAEYNPTGEHQANYGVEIGIKPIDNFNLEFIAGYDNLGTYTVANNELKTGSFHLATGPRIEVGLFSFNAHIGGHKWKSELGQVKEDGLDPYYSAGVGFKVHNLEFIELGIEYALYKDADQGRDDRETISATLTAHLF
ncbi:hypothetical protein ACN3E9_06775 [Vibrio pectenicida]|uniref:hypothetical protein n=1 Tax=Vibrio pectenicida TaxID=62763 RepID=UPI003B9D36F8